MVRILPGESWKLNPSYLASLKLAGGRAPRFSAADILDVLGIEIDGVNVSRGLSEAAIFEVADRLAAIVLRLCREPGSAGQVSLSEGAVELVLGRRGPRASLCLVSLGRPACLLAGEVEVELPALAQATAACADGLLADLTRINPALERTAYARRLARRVALLEKSARLGERRGERRTGAPSLSLSPQPPAPADGLSVGLALFDDEGRLEACRRGAELFSLLGPGELSLREPEGPALVTARAPPFLVLTDLTRAASDLVAAHAARDPAWEGALAPAGPRLRLDLVAGTLAVAGRTVPCRALQLARAFLQAALDFGGAVQARNPAQAKNPYLASLVDAAREKLEHLRETEGGDLFSAADALPRPASRAPTGAPLAATGTLKRLRFRLAWRGIDTGGPARSARLVDGALVVLGPRRATFLDAARGEPLARRIGDAAIFADGGVLLSDRARLLGLSWRGEARFLREVPGHDHPPLIASAGTLDAVGASGAATVCVLESNVIAALLSASGRIAWQFRAPQALRLSAAALKDRVFVAADTGFLYALEARAGQVLFRVRSDCAFEGPLAVGGGRVASLGRRDGTLWLSAVDAASGRPQFSRSLDLRAASAPVLTRRRVVLAGQADGIALVAGYGPDGQEQFRTLLGSGAGVPALAVHAGRLFATLRDGTVACLGRDGQLRWTAPACGLELDEAIAPALRRGVLVAPGDPMRALDPDTGALLCELPPTQGLSAMAVGSRLDVHAIDDDGVAACFQLATHLSVVG